MWIFIIILFGLQSYTLYRIVSINKIKKESEEILEKYKGVTILSKIPKRISYKDIESDWKTFYNFMENIKLEDWKYEVTEDVLRIDRDSCWVVNIISHDQKSSMTGRLRDYGDGVFLSNCNISAGSTSLIVSREDEIASDVILFLWDYVIKHYEYQNNDLRNSYQSSIDMINSQLKTLNRSKRLTNVLK
jgi:hypothetical protein